MGALASVLGALRGTLVFHVGVGPSELLPEHVSDGLPRPIPVLLEREHDPADRAAVPLDGLK